jgi:hypothetical protein
VFSNVTFCRFERGLAGGVIHVGCRDISKLTNVLLLVNLVIPSPEGVMVGCGCRAPRARASLPDRQGGIPEAMLLPVGCAGAGVKAAMRCVRYCSIRRVSDVDNWRP